MPSEINPYAAPQVTLVEEAPVRPQDGWSVTQLRLLGWLSLLSAVGALVSIGVAGASGYFADRWLAQVSQWLSPALELLGVYLLLRLKRFAEQRFQAENLTSPVMAVAVLGMLLSCMELVLGEATSEPGTPMLIYFGLMWVYGGLLVWMGIRMRKVQNAYPAFTMLAWMNIVGGLMVATVILIVLAIAPLLGTAVAMAFVFFKAARELKASA
ncbi:hypothetical protein [Pseudomonas sp. PA1(2017)]|uniref:hypothetical protein n=1 Tax=Pseudomonas sp. PA1(2017) TaxID=1932113 RepID=UPI0009F966CA|nr:hypothetical protein [Pseudomonas sp. PA1(2017)]